MPDAEAPPTPSLLDAPAFPGWLVRRYPALGRLESNPFFAAFHNRRQAIARRTRLRRWSIGASVFLFVLFMVYIAAFSRYGYLLRRFGPLVYILPALAIRAAIHARSQTRMPLRLAAGGRAGVPLAPQAVFDLWLAPGDGRTWLEACLGEMALSWWFGLTMMVVLPVGAATAITLLPNAPLPWRIWWAGCAASFLLGLVRSASWGVASTACMGTVRQHWSHIERLSGTRWRYGWRTVLRVLGTVFLVYLVVGLAAAALIATFAGIAAGKATTLSDSVLSLAVKVCLPALVGGLGQFAFWSRRPRIAGRIDLEHAAAWLDRARPLAVRMLAGDTWELAEVDELWRSMQAMRKERRRAFRELKLARRG